jgi:hypothetical protein
MMPATMTVIKPGKYADKDKNEDRQRENCHGQLESGCHYRQHEKRKQEPNEGIQNSVQHKDFTPEFLSLMTRAAIPPIVHYRRN